MNYHRLPIFVLVVSLTAKTMPNFSGKLVVNAVVLFPAIAYGFVAFALKGRPCESKSARLGDFRTGAC